LDNAAIEELFESLGPISIRRMFGGKGIYHDGAICALEVSGEILLEGGCRDMRGFPRRRFSSVGI
jgi:DNA transformation protein